jgi:hypothetical protein
MNGTLPIIWQKHMRRKGKVGERVRLYRDSAGNTRVFSLDLEELGTIDGAYQRSTTREMAIVGPALDEVTVSDFGPTQL